MVGGGDYGDMGCVVRYTGATVLGKHLHGRKMGGSKILKNVGINVPDWMVSFQKPVMIRVAQMSYCLLYLLVITGAK
jgi:hypothetical protein